MIQVVSKDYVGIAKKNLAKLAQDSKQTCTKCPAASSECFPSPQDVNSALTDSPCGEIQGTHREECIKSDKHTPILT